MRTGLTWGAAVVAMVWSGLATAQVVTPPPPPKAAPPPKAPPAATTTPDATGGAPASAPSEAPPAAPAPDATAPPVEPNVAPVAPEAAPAASDADQDEDEVQDEPKRKHKKRRKHLDEDEEEMDADAKDEEDADVVETAPHSSWRLAGSHFVLSGERLTSILAWNQTRTVDASFDGGSSGSTIDLERSGTDAALLGAGGFTNNPFAIPRIGFDGILSGGFTIGGSLSYMVTSGEAKTPAFSGIPESKQDLPTLSYFLFAPRLGVMIPASTTVGVWLRGGITRLSINVEDKDVDPNNGTTITTEQTTTLVDLSLDPQLVISPVPHVGLTVGLSLDIPLSGTAEASGGEFTTATREEDITASSYGVTAGLALIF